MFKISLNLSHFLALCIFVSCKGSGNSDSTKTPGSNDVSLIEKASWLIGRWENISEEGSMFEFWEKKNDSLYTGVSYFVKGKDTLSSETIRLEQKEEELFYTPTVSNQNEGKPVKFKLTSSSKNNLIFENPEHDFPQRISYTQISKDSLVASISGIDKEKPRAEAFPMKRIK